MTSCAIGRILGEFLPTEIFSPCGVISFSGWTARWGRWGWLSVNFSFRSWNRIMEIGLSSSYCHKESPVQLAGFFEMVWPTERFSPFPPIFPHFSSISLMWCEHGWAKILQEFCQLHSLSWGAMGRAQSNFHDSIPWFDWIMVKRLPKYPPPHCSSPNYRTLMMNLSSQEFQELCWWLLYVPPSWL